MAQLSSTDVALLRNS